MPDILFSGPFEPSIGSDLQTEDLSAQIDGSTSTFTTSQQFQETRICVFRNGLYQGPPNGSEITVTSLTTFTISSPLMQPGESLTVIYSPFLKT